MDCWHRPLRHTWKSHSLLDKVLGTIQLATVHHHQDWDQCPHLSILDIYREKNCIKFRAQWTQFQVSSCELVQIQLARWQDLPCSASLLSTEKCSAHCLFQINTEKHKVELPVWFPVEEVWYILTSIDLGAYTRTMTCDAHSDVRMVGEDKIAMNQLIYLIGLDWRDQLVLSVEKM